MEKIRYIFHVNRLTWRELWLLAGESPLSFLQLIPVKILGLTTYNKEAEVQFRITPTLFSDLPPLVKEEIRDLWAEMESLGFTYLFADLSLLTSFGTVGLYFQKNETISQIILLLATSAQVIRLMTFLESGPLLITCNESSGISNGGISENLIARNKTFSELFKIHALRCENRRARILNKEELLALLEEIHRKAVVFNLKRGVYEHINH